MRSITIQLTKNCMLKCPYCFAGNKLSEYISDDVLDTIKEFVERNQIPLIRITGGEPFLYDKCVDVINYFSENRVVCTDGSLEHCYVTSPIVKLHINQFNTYEEIESCIKQKLREYSLSCFNNEKCIGCSYYSEIPCGCFGLHSRLNEMQGIK